MDAEGILFSAERGIHLLFDTDIIAEAFEQDGETLRALVEARRTDVELVLVQLLTLPSALEARRFISALPRDLQYVLVLLYFELLDGRLGEARTLH
jgi:hypothetical protein